jgi:hypothetical protein
MNEPVVIAATSFLLGAFFGAFLAALLLGQLIGWWARRNGIDHVVKHLGITKK